MMTIQQFAVFCGTTAKTLRFYDQKGLLPADYVSPVNGYRYYHTETAETFHKIETLKRAGLTLAQIQEKLACGDEKWMIAGLEELIRRHKEKIALCEALKAEYEIRAAQVLKAATPFMDTCMIDGRLLISQGENTISAAYRNPEEARLCADIVRKGSCSDIFICLDYDTVKEVLADKTIVRAFTKELPHGSLDDLGVDISEILSEEASAFLCYVGFNPDITSEAGVSLLEDVMKRFGAKGECIFAADIDMRYSSTIIDVVVIK